MGYESARTRKERKGVRHGGRGEMPGLDITGYKSLSQHSGVLTLRQRETEGEGTERETLEQIRQTVKKSKQPLIIRINASARHHPPPVCRHPHHSLRHYPGRCDACRGQAAKMSKILSGSLEDIKIKCCVEDRRDRRGRIMWHDAPCCQQKRSQASSDPWEVAGQIIRGERRRGRG